MKTTPALQRAAALVIAAALVAACANDKGDNDTSDTATGETSPATMPVTESMPAGTDAPVDTTGDSDRVLQVPDDFATIQEAVDAAVPGDLVLIGPGTYHEAVNVTTDELTIRGLDRNTVVLDGSFELENGVRILGAKGVAVENMTARDYTSNGFF